MNIKLALQLLKNMGFRYTLYRITHELDKRSGFLKKRHPINPKTKFYISLEDWKKLNLPFIFSSRESFIEIKNPNEILKEKATKILNYQIQFFSNQWINLGESYDWITNPDTNFKYDSSKHWSEINDFNLDNGDIKYVWEKSRFAYLLTLIRYDYHFDQDNSQFVFSEINSWIDANPINQGPNWKCSQEISLRTFNWMFCLYFYKNSPFLTEELWNKIQNVIYWQLHHVHHHINFSRIAVRNNHAITETLALTLAEISFPFFPESKKWSSKGRKYFEQEVDYQIYNDGAFIQHSMNYHRVLVQLLSFGLQITERANRPFSEKVYQKSQLTLNFLYQFMQNENGNLPNYGANDGALFFLLSDSEFRDYRPQLNTLHSILYKRYLFNSHKEDLFEIGNEIPKYNFKPLQQNIGITNFDKSGYYLFRTIASFTFIKCSSYKDRPSHADNLHIDIFKNGINVFRDAGSYKYNTEPKWTNFFFGTKSHNSVMIDNQDQMKKGSRFIWYFWTKSLNVKTHENEDHFIFEGTISAFSYLSKNIKHKRKIIISKTIFEWKIEDILENTNNRIAQQIWNSNPNCNFKIEAFCDGKKVSSIKFDSYYSSLYGTKEPQNGIEFLFTNRIDTIINID